jgi:cobalt-zinc-cadmium efflux system protein
MDHSRSAGQLAGRRVPRAWLLFGESLSLPESTPPRLAPRTWLPRSKPPGVKNVHDLHIWAWNSVDYDDPSYTVDDDSAMTNELLHAIRAKDSADFGIKHMTIQMGTDCCHPDEIHCDLTTLTKQQRDDGLLHVHH